MTQSEFDGLHAEEQVVVRQLHQSQKRQKRSEVDLMNSRLLDLLLLLGIAGAGWLLLTGLSIEVGSVVAESGGLWGGAEAISIGFPGFVLGLLLGAWRLRWRINRYERWWNACCPSCASNELKRKRRRPFDRLLGRLGIPVRRYICASCQWEGRRIDPWRVR